MLHPFLSFAPFICTSLCVWESDSQSDGEWSWSPVSSLVVTTRVPPARAGRRTPCCRTSRAGSRTPRSASGPRPSGAAGRRSAGALDRGQLMVIMVGGRGRGWLPVPYDLCVGFAISCLLSTYCGCLKCESASRRFQQEEGPSRGLLHGCENFVNIRSQL